MYAKVFSSLWDGSLGQKWEGWSVFVFMLANCDRSGFVDMTQEAIAARTGMPLEAVTRGIQFLEEPDRRSRRPDLDGRRLDRIDDHRDWGWRIVNYEHYRMLSDYNTVREQNRERQSRRRHALSRSVTPASRNVTRCSPQAEAEAEAVGGITPPKPPSSALARTRDGWFEEDWKTYPHFSTRSKKKQARARYLALVRTDAQRDALRANLVRCRQSPDWTKDGGSFVPGMQVWLNGGLELSNGTNGAAARSAFDMTQEEIEGYL